MKFTIATILAAAAGVVSTQAVKLAGRKVFNGRRLMTNAIPVDKHGNVRQLNDQGFQITGEYSIQFNHCLSLKAEASDEDLMFGENTMAYTANGQIMSEKSYVLFNVCKTEYCSYDAEDNLYMVQLEDYMDSLLEIASQDKENYCEACDYDYCNPEEDEAEEAAEGEDGGRRRLSNRRRGLSNIVYTTCEQCEAYSCFDDENENNNQNNQNVDDANFQLTDEAVLEWAQGMAECSEIENGYWNGMELYGGFMCNENGDGVEVAVFLDEDCTVYTTTQSYSALVAGTYNYQYMYAAADIVVYPFMSDIDCIYTEYASPGDAEDGEDEQQAEEEEEAEAQEFCQQLIENSVDMATCGGWEQDENQNNNNQNQNQDDEVDYSWYTYVVSQEDSEDLQAVCKVVESFEGEYSNAHVYTNSDGEGGGSGHVYDYKSSSNQSNGMNAGKVFGIIIAIVVLVVAAVMIVQSCGGKRDSKKVPLVNKSGGSGAMA